MAAAPLRAHSHKAAVFLDRDGVLNRVLLRDGAVVFAQGRILAIGPARRLQNENPDAIVHDAGDVWGAADLIIKVKEPLPVEWPLMRPGQIVFTYFHFAADEELTRAVMKSGITAMRRRPEAFPRFSTATRTSAARRPLS